MPKGIIVFETLFLGFFFFTGLLHAVYPKKMWEVFESWKATQQPTNTFFIIRRIAGIVMILIVFSIYLLPRLL